MSDFNMQCKYYSIDLFFLINKNLTGNIFFLGSSSILLHKLTLTVSPIISLNKKKELIYSSENTVTGFLLNGIVNDDTLNYPFDPLFSGIFANASVWKLSKVTRT